MGLIIVKADFTGKYKIAQNNFSDIDSYISKYEELYLKELLGVELFNLFKADVVSYAPVTTIYLNIFNPISEDDTDNETIRISDGIKEILLGFIFFEFMKDDKFKATPSGIVAGQSENNRETSFAENNIYEKYNIAVNSYHTIQWYIEILNNKVDYPTYNGQEKDIASWI